MNNRWRAFGNASSPVLVSAWKTILSAFNQQLDGKEGLLTCDAVCGTGKTTSVQEACGVLARDSPTIGGLVVVRLIRQADEVAEGINQAAGRQVALSLHSGKGGQHQDEDVENTQFIVITHARYLASVSPSGGKKSFRNWKHGERRLRICDESLDLVERHTLTQRELIDLHTRLTGTHHFYETLEDEFEEEYNFLKNVSRKVTKGELVMGFNKGVFDDILQEQKEQIYLSSFIDVLSRYPSKDWVSCKTPKGQDSAAYFEEWKEETIAYIQTFDRIVRYRMCHLDLDMGASRLSTGTFLLPESFESLVVLDATSNVDTIYNYFKAKEVTKFSVPRRVRNFKNARLHFRPDPSGLGKNETKKTIQKRVPQILRWADDTFSKTDRVLFAGHKVLMNALESVLLTKEYDFVDRVVLPDGQVKLRNVDFAHYGIIDGENKWRDYENLVILSIPYLPSYYSPTAMMALHRDGVDLEDKEDIASSNIAVKLIQLICRIVIRMVSDKKGNCPEADIYLLLDGDEPYPGDVHFRPLLKRISPYLLAQIEESLHNITIDNWESFNGFQTRTSNSIPKGGVTDAFISWLGTLEAGVPVNKKVFEQANELSKAEISTLSVQLSKANSPVKRALNSKNILVQTKRGKGTTFTKLESAS
mgnify:CR=1 FL=1